MTIENPAQLARVLEWRKNILGIPKIPAHIIQAVAKVDRTLFVPPDQKSKAHEDMPLPIGEGQTSSDPAVVAALCAHGAITLGYTVLEVGGGCGYAAAVIAQIVGPTGKVVSVEIKPDLAQGAKAALIRAQLDNVEMHCGDASAGWSISGGKKPLYDAILFAAGAGPHFDPEPLRAQLRPGGRLLVPSPVGPVAVYGTSKNSKPRKVGSAMFVCLQGINSGFR